MAEQATAEQVKSMEELVSFLSHPRPELLLPPTPAAPVKAIEAKKEPEPATKVESKPKAVERKPVTASSTLPTSGEDEEVSDDVADGLAHEISALDVSSDEEEDEDDLGVD
ncbi:30S ribosomal protein S18 [Phytophthora nicotianae]|uniref:30S ribosomal protein S18 n=1 Tax=Phytophthora nicotianae TaxID=4792 RepID=A0A0W8DKQ6_PHYNI|nr:30S ribosomal protein S18 [Phytophthora nicotianae]